MAQESTLKRFGLKFLAFVNITECVPKQSTTFAHIVQ